MFYISCTTSKQVFNHTRLFIWNICFQTIKFHFEISENLVEISLRIYLWLRLSNTPILRNTIHPSGGIQSTECFNVQSFGFITFTLRLKIYPMLSQKLKLKQRNRTCKDMTPQWNPHRSRKKMLPWTRNILSASINHMFWILLTATKASKIQLTSGGKITPPCWKTHGSIGEAM